MDRNKIADAIVDGQSQIGGLFVAAFVDGYFHIVVRLVDESRFANAKEDDQEDEYDARFDPILHNQIF